MTAEEEMKVQAFIDSGRVTPCPGFGSRELAEHHRRGTEAWNAMTPQQKLTAFRKKFTYRLGVPKIRTPEEKKAGINAAQRAYYNRNKEKFRLRAKERWAREKARREEEKQ